MSQANHFFHFRNLAASKGRKSDLSKRIPNFIS